MDQRILSTDVVVWSIGSSQRPRVRLCRQGSDLQFIAYRGRREDARWMLKAYEAAQLARIVRQFLAKDEGSLVAGRVFRAEYCLDSPGRQIHFRKERPGLVDLLFWDQGTDHAVAYRLSNRDATGLAQALAHAGRQTPGA